MVSETGGHPVGRVCVVAERVERLHTRRFEMVHDAVPRSRRLRGTSPLTWGRRD